MRDDWFAAERVRAVMRISCLPLADLAPAAAAASRRRRDLLGIVDDDRMLKLRLKAM